MWGMNRFVRPAWTTGSLIPLSFICGITSAVLIGRGSQSTKRTKEVEERLRMALAAERGHVIFGIESDKSGVARSQNIGTSRDRNDQGSRKGERESNEKSLRERDLSHPPYNEKERSRGRPSSIQIIIDENMDIPAHVGGDGS